MPITKTTPLRMFFFCIALSVALVTHAQEPQRYSAPIRETPRALPVVEDLGRAPLNQYGLLEETIQKMRAYRPLDLNAAEWRRAHPRGKYTEWAARAQMLLGEGLHYDPGSVKLDAKTTDRWETDSFVRETIEFNTTPWFRVPGYFYIPKNVPLPAPALVVFHEWGGPMLFGADRVSGEPVHPAIVKHREQISGGRAIADWFASQGYCVIVIDAYHFGKRAPRGVNGLPERYDPAKLDDATLKEYEAFAKDALYYGVRELNWAGTTWAGLNFWDDSRCVDYLLTRKEVDGNRIGCTGLSGGGWRTNMMIALEPRIKAAVSVGWMTTGDTQQPYNLAGAIGTFCLLPGVWEPHRHPGSYCHGGAEGGNGCQRYARSAVPPARSTRSGPADRRCVCVGRACRTFPELRTREAALL